MTSTILSKSPSTDKVGETISRITYLIHSEDKTNSLSPEVKE
jgi:hypothetical protein